MHCTKLVQRAAAAAAVVGLVVGGVAAPASAAPAKPKAVSKPAPKPAPLVSKFTAAGHVTAVGSATLTITLDVKGGNQKLKGQSMTVSVPSTAVVTRNGVAATLADLLAGDHVAIQGSKVGTSYTAAKVHVDAPVVVPAPVTEPVV